MTGSMYMRVHAGLFLLPEDSLSLSHTHTLSIYIDLPSHCLTVRLHEVIKD